MLTDDRVPLPQPTRMSSDQSYLGYHAEQMREYAHAVEREAYKRAIHACLSLGKDIVCPEECAEAIEALGREE